MSEQRITTLASQAHDEWRQTRWNGSGYEPRPKSVKDKMWIAAHYGQTSCDIANTDYVDLPSEWQAENRAGAQVAITLVEAQIQADKPLDDEFIERASDIVHKKWVKRNPWADARLKVAYSKLPEDEKEKDRIFVRKAIAICNL